MKKIQVIWNMDRSLMITVTMLKTLVEFATVVRKLKHLSVPVCVLDQWDLFITHVSWAGFKGLSRQGAKFAFTVLPCEGKQKHLKRWDLRFLYSNAKTVFHIISHAFIGFGRGKPIINGCSKNKFKDEDQMMFLILYIP